MSIPISRDGGLEPHLTYCPRCGGETPELTIGVAYWLTWEGPISNEYGFNRGQKIGVYNRGRRSPLLKTMGLEHVPNWLGRVHVERHEKLPASEPCDECKAEIEEHKQIVKDGGVYFKCAECGRDGVIKDSPFARRVREISVDVGRSKNVHKPCGIQFVKCTEHAVEEANSD